MYGKEGTGKTTIMKHYYTDSVIKNNALVFFVNELDYKLSNCWDFIINIREVQNNPIIVVFDEFDQQFSENEGVLKTVLDGNKSIDNCVFFASTNYLDKIPNAIKDRESRFKYTIKIGGIECEEHVFELIDVMLDSSFSKNQKIEFSAQLKGSTLDKIKQFCMDKIMNLERDDTPEKKMGF